MAIGDSFNVEQYGGDAEQYTARLVGSAYTTRPASTMNTKADIMAYSRFTRHTPANNVGPTAGVTGNIHAVRPVKVTELFISASPQGTGPSHKISCFHTFGQEVLDGRCCAISRCWNQRGKEATCE